MRYRSPNQRRNRGRGCIPSGDDFVYFVQAEDGGPVKIGRSRAPSDRLRELQTAHPSKLVLRRIVKVHESKSRLMEENLHKHFAEHRLNGEWFAPVPELLTLARAV